MKPTNELRWRKWQPGEENYNGLTGPLCLQQKWVEEMGTRYMVWKEAQW